MTRPQRRHKEKSKNTPSSNRKAKTAMLSIISNTSLIAGKAVVGVLSGSVSIVSEAIHSSMDLLAAMIAFFSVKNSDKAPDKEHPFGHGKIENVSGVIEALLIVVASVLIVIEAVKKMLHPEPVDVIWLGFVVMIVASTVNTIVARRLYKVAEEEESQALAADALHLKADVITSLGVALGLLAIWIGGLAGVDLTFLDPIVAIGVAVFIIKEAIGMLRESFQPLMDHSLSKEEEAQIEEALSEVRSLGGNFHDLRTRRSGKIRYIDCHITLDATMQIQESHAVCDRLEKAISERIPNANVLIHVEPQS